MRRFEFYHTVAIALCCFRPDMLIVSFVNDPLALIANASHVMSANESVHALFSLFISSVGQETDAPFKFKRSLINYSDFWATKYSTFLSYMN
jgi:hypothetical protein